MSIYLSKRFPFFQIIIKKNTYIYILPSSHTHTHTPCLPVCVGFRLGQHVLTSVCVYCQRPRRPAQHRGNLHLSNYILHHRVSFFFWRTTTDTTTTTTTTTILSAHGRGRVGCKRRARRRQRPVRGYPHRRLRVGGVGGRGGEVRRRVRVRVEECVAAAAAAAGFVLGFAAVVRRRT
jgi:hypothetical protein